MTNIELSYVKVGDAVLPVRTARAADEPHLFFPSLGEYHSAYNEWVYSLFSQAAERNSAYLRALASSCIGRVVVDIGTGPDALWAVAAARSGARRVYAIERRLDVAERARQSVADAGLTGVVTVIAAHSSEVCLPEPADVCVSEIIGNIGSAEGAAVVLDDVRQRLCRSDCSWVPYRCQTCIAAVDLSRLMPADTYAIAEESLPYLARIFQQVGRAFDVRLCLSGVVDAAVVSEPAVVEDMRFGHALEARSESTKTLLITDDARLTGFLFWIRLWCTDDGPDMDSLSRDDPSWAPVYAPLSRSGIPVTHGTSLRVRFTRVHRSDATYPDYQLTVWIPQIDGVDRQCSWSSAHSGTDFRANDVYRHLFPPSSG